MSVQWDNYAHMNYEPHIHNIVVTAPWKLTHFWTTIPNFRMYVGEPLEPNTVFMMWWDSGRGNECSVLWEKWTQLVSSVHVFVKLITTDKHAVPHPGGGKIARSD